MSQPPNKSMWGESPKKRRWSGYYETCDYSPRGGFGPREAGSTLANSAVHAAMLGVAFETEKLAHQYGVNAPTGVAFGSAWLVGLLLKVLAGFLRNYGSSMLRDLGAFLWSHFLSALWASLFGWLRPSRWFGGRFRDRDRGDTVTPPYPNPTPDPGRRPIFDFFFPRRRR